MPYPSYFNSTENFPQHKHHKKGKHLFVWICRVRITSSTQKCSYRLFWMTNQEGCERKISKFHLRLFAECTVATENKFRYVVAVGMTWDFRLHLNFCDSKWYWCRQTCSMATPSHEVLAKGKFVSLLKLAPCHEDVSLD